MDFSLKSMIKVKTNWKNIYQFTKSLYFQTFSNKFENSQELPINPIKSQETSHH
jgi:hypothetical protein